ncbi:MAG: PEP-CTERM sorting domain-containing protein [Phycisphaerae bacterium]|nr:PEP-CTERM sorting domain-containing protein [Phycisphaerae bacterium]
MMKTVAVVAAGLVLSLTGSVLRADTCWTLDGTLPEPVGFHGVAAFGEDGIFVFGGQSGAGGAANYSRAYMYYPGGGWNDDDYADMPDGRHWMAFAQHQGRVYSIGGVKNPPCGPDWCRTKDVWSYDPLADPPETSWTTHASLDYARAQNAGASVGDYLYTVGGHHEDTDHGFSLSRVERYESQEDAWEGVAPLLHDDRVHSYLGEAVGRQDLGTAVIGGKIYAIGGLGYERDVHADQIGGWVESYDPDVDAWDDSLPSMLTPRRDFATAVLGDRIFTIGGVDQSGTVTSVVEYYDVSDGAWYAPDCWEFPVGVQGARAVTMNDKIYVLGGVTAGSMYLDTVYVIPEPATLSLLALGGLAMIRRGRRCRA